MNRTVVLHALWLLLTAYICWRLLIWAESDMFGECLHESPKNPTRGFMRLAFMAVVLTFLLTLQGWVAFRARR